MAAGSAVEAGLAKEPGMYHYKSVGWAAAVGTAVADWVVRGASERVELKADEKAGEARAARRPASWAVITCLAAMVEFERALVAEG